MTTALLILALFITPPTEPRLELDAVLLGWAYDIKPSQIMAACKIESGLATGKYLIEKAGSADCGIMQTRNKYARVPCWLRAAIPEIGMWHGVYVASYWKRFCGDAMWDAYKNGWDYCWDGQEQERMNCGNDCLDRSDRTKAKARRWRGLDRRLRRWKRWLEDFAILGSSII